jgi:1-aminocyclopropane-1-carboxylate deaminase
MERWLPELQLPSPLVHFPVKAWESAGVKVWMKRDDLIHPDIPGNKWRKLKYHLPDFFQSGKSVIASFGGAYSNHLAALAAVCHYLNIRSIGFIRGELTEQSPLYHTLQRFGMRVIHLSRGEFSRWEDPDFRVEWESKFNEPVYFIASGGEGDAGVSGCREIIQEIDMAFDYIVCPCGTGTTLAGIASMMKSNQKAIGISALKGQDLLTEKVSGYAPMSAFEVITGYHFGGFGKKTDQLTDFILQIQQETRILLDYVYTGKMIWAVNDLIINGYFKSGDKIILLHTGGVTNAAVNL